jgi:hypothetical protein
MKSITRLQKGLDITSKHITANRLKGKINQTISLKDTPKAFISDVNRVYTHNDGSIYGNVKNHYNKVIKVKCLNAGLGVWVES